MTDFASANSGHGVRALYDSTYDYTLTESDHNMRGHFVGDHVCNGGTRAIDI